MTTDHILSAALTFALLAGGTAAVGTELFAPRHAPPAAVAIVTLPAVTVVGRRAAATALAAETRVDEPQRLQ